jgi:hypothetical protein
LKQGRFNNPKSQIQSIAGDKKMFYTDYNSGIYNNNGYRFGEDWIGQFAQYTKRNAGFYPAMCKKLRRELEIKANQKGYKQIETHINPITGRAGIKK